MSLNVALIGYGFAGKSFHAPLIATTPGLRLHTVVSSDPDKVRANWPDARVVPDAADANSDPDIGLVVVATPNPLHAPQADAALEAGKAVVIDKPFAITAAEARNLVEKSEARGLVLSVFHNRRWDSDFLTLRRLIGDGRLGEVVQFESHFDRYRPVVRDRWRERPGPGAGAWFDLGPHLLDQALVLFGEPLAIQADIASQRQADMADDYFHVVLRYPRLRAILHASMLTPARGARLIVHGTGGTYTYVPLDPQEGQLKSGLLPTSPRWGRSAYSPVLTTAVEDERTDITLDPEPGDYGAYYRGVRDAVLHGAPKPVSPREALRVMELLELAARSSVERREIPL
jgi:predicted dehydrogenase